jgi:hypothetical protein
MENGQIIGASRYPYYYNLADLTGGVINLPPNPPQPILTDSLLTFVDEPAANVSPLSAQNLEFETGLVGIPIDGGPPQVLYTFTWSDNFNGVVIGGLSARSNWTLPIVPGSGTGGVTITSVNGVQLNPVSSSQISATASGLAYSRVSQTFNGTVTIKNVGTTSINGPVQIVLMSLTPGVMLANATGSFVGNAYITLPVSGGLGPGQSVTVFVQFKNPANAKINFAPVVYSGSLN